MKTLFVIVSGLLISTVAAANDTGAIFKCKGAYSNDTAKIFNEPLLFKEVTYPIKDAWMVIAKTSDGLFEVRVNYHAPHEYGAYQILRATGEYQVRAVSGNLTFPKAKAKQDAWATYQDVGISGDLNNSENLSISCKLNK